MIGFILGLRIVGLFAGARARLLVPGRQKMSIPATILIGIIGSFVGGFLGNLIFDAEASLDTAGIIGSIIGAIIVLLIWIKVSGSEKTKH